MKSLDASRWSSYFKTPNPGLRAYFGRVRAGQPLEYRTNFYGQEPLLSILSRWEKKLEAIRSRWPSLWDYEQSLRAKVGPLSIMKPLSKRLDDIGNYYEDISLPQVPIPVEALTATLREWTAARGLSLRSQLHTLEAMKLSTNSGSPYFNSKRKNVISETAPCQVWWDAHEKSVIMQQPDQTWLGTAILGWRGQEGGIDVDDVKQRVVWMFPFAANIAELQFYQPAILAAQQHNLVPAWNGMEAVDIAITHLFDTKRAEDVIICTDFSKFDQHFNPVMQSAAATLIQGLLDTSPQSEEWLQDVFPVKYNIPLAYDYSKIRFGPHGMASGSGGTNFDETLVHRSLQYEAAQRIGATLNPYSQCLGDDGILSAPNLTVDTVIDVYSSHGQVMNPEKQEVATDHCTYLRRWHHEDYRMKGICVGVYSTFRALGRLCEQERWYSGWSREAVALRQLSIIENVKYHPLREEFAEFCMQGDKYRLGLDIPGFLDNITDVIEETIGDVRDFMSYTQVQGMDAATGSGGIRNWWIYQYLQSKKSKA